MEIQIAKTDYFKKGNEYSSKEDITRINLISTLSGANLFNYFEIDSIGTYICIKDLIFKQQIYNLN